MSLVFVIKTWSKVATYIVRNKTKSYENSRFVVLELVAGSREQDITILDHFALKYQKTSGMATCINMRMVNRYYKNVCKVFHRCVLYAFFIHTCQVPRHTAWTVKIVLNLVLSALFLSIKWLTTCTISAHKFQSPSHSRNSIELSTFRSIKRRPTTQNLIKVWPSRP